MCQLGIKYDKTENCTQHKESQVEQHFHSFIKHNILLVFIDIITFLYIEKLYIYYFY